jgi:ribokinase
LPGAGETVSGSALRIGMGGKGSNQATAAHRCGGDVCMVGCSGKDAMSDVVRRHYENEGMSRTYIAESDTAETGTALIEVDASGQNRIVVVAGANAEVSAAQVERAAAEIGQAGAVLTQLEIRHEPLLAAKKLAEAHDVPFVINPAPYSPMPAELLAGTDWLTPNETEASCLAGVEVKDAAGAAAAARAIRAMGVKNVLITLGSQGVYALWEEDGALKDEKLSPPSVKAVDTTGAGDAFNGAFTVALAEGRTVSEALRFASCCASLSVTKAGAADAMPSREETLALLKETYGLDW